MATRTLRTASAAALIALAVTGCSSLGTEGGFTTASIPETPKVDPACVSLTSQIDGLRREGVADKIANAAAKKYRMTPADLAKADQLNKANADFQARCSTVPRAPAQQQASAIGATSATVAAAPAAAPKAAAAQPSQ